MSITQIITNEREEITLYFIYKQAIQF